MAEQAANRRRLSWLRPRFTIRALLWTTTIIAAMFPAIWFAWFLLLNASTAWGSTALLGTALLLALTAAIAISFGGAKRAFWSGFAAVGLAYFLIVVCNITASAPTYSMFDPERLATTQLNRWAYREYVLPMLIARFGNSFPSGSGAPMVEDFNQVAQLLWTLLFACGGGLVSLLIWAIGRPRPGHGADDEGS